MLRIFDLDNTISDDQWRMANIKHKEKNLFEKYDLYHKSSAWDRIENVSLLHQGGEVIIFTSRPETYRDITDAWLKKNGVVYDYMFMRPEGNIQGSRVLKASLLSRLLALELVDNIEDITAYDDRKDVIDMYKSKGIKAVLTQINRRD